MDGWERMREREREQNESHRRCKKNERKGKSVLAWGMKNDRKREKKEWDKIIDEEREE